MKKLIYIFIFSISINSISFSKNNDEFKSDVENTKKLVKILNDFQKWYIKSNQETEKEISEVINSVDSKKKKSKKNPKNHSEISEKENILDKFSPEQITMIIDIFKQALLNRRAMLEELNDKETLREYDNTIDKIKSILSISDKSNKNN